MSDQENKPEILGPSHVKRAIGDPNFYAQMPEFLTIKRKLDAMHINLNSGKGCSSCKMRRAANTVYSDFASIVASLSPDSLARFKKYLGVNKLVINKVNPATNRVSLQEV
jgi:hypothetical protein